MLDGVGSGYLDGHVDNNGQCASRAEHGGEKGVFRSQCSDVTVGCDDSHLHNSLAKKPEPARKVTAQPPIRDVAGDTNPRPSADRQGTTLRLDCLDKFAEDHSRADSNKLVVTRMVKLDFLEFDQIEYLSIVIGDERNAGCFVATTDTSDRCCRGQRFHDGCNFGR